MVVIFVLFLLSQQYYLIHVVSAIPKSHDRSLDCLINCLFVQGQIVKKERRLKERKFSTQENFRYTQFFFRIKKKRFPNGPIFFLVFRLPAPVIVRVFMPSFDEEGR